MNIKQTELFLSRIQKMRALVIGDVMTDAYLWGKVERISPEAPVPVVTVQKRESRPGGAANVAVNLHSLGAMPYICSVVGKDNAGAEFKDMIAKSGMPVDGILSSSKRTTTIKSGRPHCHGISLSTRSNGIYSRLH